MQASTTKGTIALQAVRDSVGDTAPAVSRRWIHSNSPTTAKYFTFNTPIGIKPEDQRGRAVFTDVHVSVQGGTGTFPSFCNNNPLNESYGYSRIIDAFPVGRRRLRRRVTTPPRTRGRRVGRGAARGLGPHDHDLDRERCRCHLSFLPPTWHAWKLPVAFAGVTLLTLMNLPGVKESVTALLPIFMLFLVTHAVLLAVAIGGHASDLSTVSSEVRANVAQSAATLGTFGALKLFFPAYSMGGGTYTGIEAVSNGVAMMREPRVATAKRTMVWAGKGGHARAAAPAR